MPRDPTRAEVLQDALLESMRRNRDPIKAANERTASMPEETHHELAIEVALLRQSMKALEETITRLVSRAEFAPVKLIAYGLAGSILAGVVGAVLSKVLVK